MRFSKNIMKIIVVMEQPTLNKTVINKNEAIINREFIRQLADSTLEMWLGEVNV